MESPIYAELFKLTEKHVEHYRTDFDHDKNTLNKSIGDEFIHIARECGTYLGILSYDTTDFPKKGEKTPYLFGTADREHILNDCKITLDHYLKREPRSIYYFDGKKLKPITEHFARTVMDTYISNVKHQWELQEQNQVES